MDKIASARLPRVDLRDVFHEIAALSSTGGGSLLVLLCAACSADGVGVIAGAFVAVLPLAVADPPTDLVSAWGFWVLGGMLYINNRAWIP